MKKSSYEDCQLEIATAVNDLFRNCYMLADIANDCPGDLTDSLTDLLEVQKNLSQLINKIDRIENGN